MLKSPIGPNRLWKKIRWRTVAVWTVATAISAAFWAQAAHLLRVI